MVSDFRQVTSLASTLSPSTAGSRPRCMVRVDESRRSLVEFFSEETARLSKQ
jgi:hypothetical protein